MISHSRRRMHNVPLPKMQWRNQRLSNTSTTPCNLHCQIDSTPELKNSYLEGHVCRIDHPEYSHEEVREVSRSQHHHCQYEKCQHYVCRSYFHQIGCPSQWTEVLEVIVYGVEERVEYLLYFVEDLHRTDFYQIYQNFIKISNIISLTLPIVLSIKGPSPQQK